MSQEDLKRGESLGRANRTASRHGLKSGDSFGRANPVASQEGLRSGESLGRANHLDFQLCQWGLKIQARGNCKHQYVIHWAGGHSVATHHLQTTLGGPPTWLWWFGTSKLRSAARRLGFFGGPAPPNSARRPAGLALAVRHLQTKLGGPPAWNWWFGTSKRNSAARRLGFGGSAPRLVAREHTSPGAWFHGTLLLCSADRRAQLGGCCGPSIKEPAFRVGSWYAPGHLGQQFG